VFNEQNEVKEMVFEEEGEGTEKSEDDLNGKKNGKLSKQIKEACD
jgi:hypothetical protein